MKALQLKETGLFFAEIPVPKPAAGEVLIRLKTAALNRRDYWISVGKYPGIRPGVTLGSDGCGEVTEVGKGTDSTWIDKTVLINPNVNWGKNPAVQSDKYSVLGMPTDGTFAEYLCVPADRLHEKPAHLSDEEAAALPLAGLTAFRAVFTKAQLQAGQKILITGIGGGVSQAAFLFAQAAGAEVFVSSGSAEKTAEALAQGAAGAYNYKNPEELKVLASKIGGFNAVVDSGGGAAINDFIRFCKPDGRIVIYGATGGLPEKTDLARLFFRQISIHGSTMGNDREFEEMLGFTEEKNLRPVIDSVRDFADAPAAFERMAGSLHLGKLVLKIS